MSIKLKKCNKCKSFFSIIEFNKNKVYKDGLCSYCKTCYKLYSKKYRITHKQEIAKYQKEYFQNKIDSISVYRQNNRESILAYKINYNKVKFSKFPWLKTYKSIFNRCNYKSHNRYCSYGAKGIKCLITKEELKTLWFRDKAYNLEKPSIDRKNPYKSYTFDNCRYIELIQNLKRKRRKRI